MRRRRFKRRSFLARSSVVLGTGCFATRPGRAKAPAVASVMDGATGLSGTVARTIACTLGLLVFAGCGEDEAAPAGPALPAKPRHACPSIATDILGEARTPAPLVAMFAGIPNARILERGYDDAIDEGVAGFWWSAGTLDQVSGDPPPGGLTLDAARARLTEAAPGVELYQQVSRDNRTELSVELPSTTTYRSSLDLSAFYSSVREVTFTCTEAKADLGPLTLGALATMGALPVDLPSGVLSALGEGAIVHRLSGRVGLGLSLEPDPERPVRLARALEAEGFARKGEGPQWSFERTVEGQRHSARLSGNGSMLTMTLGGLHSTFTYR